MVVCCNARHGHCIFGLPVWIVIGRDHGCHPSERADRVIDALYVQRHGGHEDLQLPVAAIWQCSALKKNRR
jgi:hypothetical protein